MADFIPINFPAIEAKLAQREAKFRLAQQVATEDRFTETVEEGFNPIAFQSAQARLNRFRPLDQRRRVLEARAEVKLEEVSKKTDDDLAQEFQRRNPELPANRLRELRELISDEMSEDGIIDATLAEFGDPTLADEALEFLLRSTTGSLREKIRRARLLFHEEHWRQIVAGRNISPIARAFHEQGLGDNPTELRELYRNITGTMREHNALFSELSNKYPFDKLKSIVAFLLQGLVYDLKSKGPSIQEAELVYLMTELRNLQSILWVYLFFKSRMKMLKGLFVKHNLPFSKAITFEKLAKDFIKLVEERYPTVLKILKQMEDLGIVEEGKIFVLTQYKDAVRQLSPRVYKSPRHQQDLLTIILETLDELEEEEEKRE